MSESAVVVIAEASTVQASYGAPRGVFDDKRGGLGLLLPLARRVIEGTGATCGRRAAVTMRTTVSARGAASSLFTLGVQPVKKPYVAIVDDDSAFANYCGRSCPWRGYDTRSYSRGDEMLAAVKQGDPPDIVLPRRDDAGDERARTLRALNPRSPTCRQSCCPDAITHRPIVEAVRLGAARLRRQAGRPRGSRADRARCRDQKRHREDAPRLRNHRAPPAAERRLRIAPSCSGVTARHAGDRDDDRAVCRTATSPVLIRGESGVAQGARRPGHSSAFAAPRSSLRER